VFGPFDWYTVIALGIAAVVVLAVVICRVDYRPDAAPQIAGFLAHETGLRMRRF